jgi:ribosomal-protein-alanine N-acetyltransferase
MTNNPPKPLPDSLRLQYEALGPQHAAELFTPLSDPALYTYQPGDPPTTPDGLHQRFQRWESTYSSDRSERWLNWLVRSKDSNEPIGMLQATVSPAHGPDPSHTAYIAYFIFTDHQRQGYATEAVRWMLDLVQSEYACTSATAEVDTRNDASNRLLRKLGFEQTGMAKAADFFKGASSDEFQYLLALT